MNETTRWRRDRDKYNISLHCNRKADWCAVTEVTRERCKRLANFIAAQL